MTNTSEVENKETSESNKGNNTSSNNSDIPPEIVNIMEYLSRNTNIVFKSQQRDEPELQNTEKHKLALDVYQKNPQTFLIRFGHYLEEKHLEDFARLSVADSDEEMHQMILDYRYKLKTRQRDIKNRRYTALQKLIEEGEYFSEQEMMKRQPELYQDLVGQYLSSKEKQQRDSYDVKNTTFSGILMHNLEQNQLNEIMEKVEDNTKNCASSEDISLTSSPDNKDKDDVEIPLNCRQQWGNFDNEQIACSSSKVGNKMTSFSNEAKIRPVSDLITANERELLRQEFISQMHQQFLTGQDKDFDYTAVDDNTRFDDLTLINQDKEDEYFEESDDESTHAIEVENGRVSLSKKINGEESEDELDTYMSHLSKHHSLQKNN